VMPGNLAGADFENFVRNGVMTYWHQTSTAKMGRDSMSVVDGNLKVYGVEDLRIADASIMPRVTTGNTMAPCVIIGERAAELLRNEYQMETASASDLTRRQKLDSRVVVTAGPLAESPKFKNMNSRR
jgi:choline dehydrogenase